MAKNETGTYVHVHADPEDGGGTVVVPPGGDFPSWFDADKSLTGAPDADDDADQVVPGPGQVRVSSGPADGLGAWKSWKVPEIRAALDADGTTYEADDRKDALVARAIEAGIDPEGPKPEVS